MKYTLTLVVLVCTAINRVHCAPIDDQITASSGSVVGSDVDINPNESETNPDIQTTARVILKEDIAFFSPTTTINTIASAEEITTPSTSNVDPDSVAITNVEEDQASTDVTTTIPATTSTLATTTTSKKSLQPVIIKESSDVELFTPNQPFVLICEAENPTGVEETAKIKYSWNKDGRPFEELNDPANQIYAESSTNGNILFVAPKSPAHEGTYQCVAENRFGKTYSKGALVMERKTAGSPRSIQNFNSVINPEDGGPIIGVVPENIPDFGLNREAKLVFIVYPSVPEQPEDVQVINMTTSEEDDDVPVPKNILEEDPEKERLVNEVKGLLDLLPSTESDISEEDVDAQEELESATEPLASDKVKLVDDIQDLLEVDNQNSDVTEVSIELD